MFKSFFKGLLVVSLVVVLGFIAGYYSDAALKKISPAGTITGFNKYLAGIKAGDKAGEKETVHPDKGKVAGSAPKYIAEGEAVAAVKKAPEVAEILTGEAEKIFFFRAQTGPAKENPVWLIAMDARNRAALPRNTLFRVDAVKGQVLNLREADLVIGELKIGDNRRKVEETLGKGLQVSKSYDSINRRQVRIFKAAGLTVEWTKKTGVYSISLQEPGITTFRGLQVGDPVEKLYRLYGRPDAEQDGFAVYRMILTGRDALAIKVLNQKITEIRLK